MRTLPTTNIRCCYCNRSIDTTKLYVAEPDHRYDKALRPVAHVNCLPTPQTIGSRR